MRTWCALLRVFAAPLLAVLLVAACGEQDDNTAGLREYGPGVTATVPNFTPISNATPMGTRAAATAAAAATGAAATGGSTRDVTVVGKDNFFEQRELTIRNQESVRLTFRNEGSAIHNWHVRNVRDASGREPATDLIPGNQQTSITFTIAQPGTYTYICDVHPVEMTGRLTVQ